jgi:hypothetical protein
MLPDPKTTLSQATKKAWTLFDEFKAFAFKGNVVDLAIGVIIGGAFHNIIDSLVKNLIMPVIAILVPGQRPYTHWQFTVRGARSTSACCWATSRTSCSSPLSSSSSSSSSWAG